jgi:hypothetical protein
MFGHQNQTLRLNKEELEDLALWLNFLSMAREGISMNGLTLRNPTILSVSDSCSCGLGGFTTNGRAWRLKVSSSSFIYNVLEFLAMTITIWLALKECEEEGKVDKLILALGDNTSAIGWMFKTGKLTKDSPYYTAANSIARKTADLLSRSKNFLVSQHIPGKENEIADWLTFEGADRSNEIKPVQHPIAYDCPSNNQLTARLLTLFPQSLPQHFAISPLPTKIFLFAQESVQMLKSSMMQRPKDATKQTTKSAGDGSSSSSTTSKDQTPILEENQQVKPPRSSEPFSRYIERLSSRPKESFVDSVKNRWQARLLEMPRGLWERSSGTISGGRPCTVGPSRTKSSSSPI